MPPWLGGSGRGSTAAASAWLLVGLRTGNLLTSPGFGFCVCETGRGGKKKSVLHRTVGRVEEVTAGDMFRRVWPIASLCCRFIRYLHCFLSRPRYSNRGIREDGGLLRAMLCVTGSLGRWVFWLVRFVVKKAVMSVPTCRGILGSSERMNVKNFKKGTYKMGDGHA